MWRWLARAGGGALVCVAACHPPAATQPPAGAASRPRASALPEPGVYVLERVRGMALPADLRPTGPYQPAGGYKSFKRVLAGWLYLTPDSSYDRYYRRYHPYNRYQTMICADLVDSTGRVAESMDGGPGEGAYWVAGGRVYFSVPVTDAMPDSIAVRVQGDTVEFGREVYVLDRTAVRPRNLIPSYICPAIRATAARGRWRGGGPTTRPQRVRREPTGAWTEEEANYQR